MAIDFPSTPATDDTYTYNGRTWVFDGTGWRVQSFGVGTLPVANGGTGQTTEAEAVGELIQALTADTAPANAADYLATYDASTDTGKKVLLSTIIREKLATNRTYYVRNDGSDSNTGLVNNSGGAFLTIGAALTAAAALDCLSFNCTIEVAAGTFAENVILPRMLGAGTFTINGVGATTIIQPGSGNPVQNWFTSTRWLLSNVKLAATNSDLLTVRGGGSSVGISAVEFGAAGTAAHIGLAQGGLVNCTGNYSISGSSAIHVGSGSCAQFSAFGRTITLTGTPAFSGVFALAATLSIQTWGGVTFSGSATGGRYLVQTGGVIDTGGGGASFLPGNSAGSGGTTTGGGFYG